MTLPRIDTYGHYSSSNYGAHTLKVDIGRLTLYFSYNTVVAFENGAGLKVRQNDWGPTTGKHLRWIDGGNKTARLASAAFEHNLQTVLKEHDLL